jgi:hypothetical protein
LQNLSKKKTGMIPEHLIFLSVHHFDLALYT